MTSEYNGTISIVTAILFFIFSGAVVTVANALVMSQSEARGGDLVAPTIFGDTVSEDVVELKCTKCTSERRPLVAPSIFETSEEELENVPVSLEVKDVQSILSKEGFDPASLGSEDRMTLLLYVQKEIVAVHGNIVAMNREIASTSDESGEEEAVVSDEPTGSVSDESDEEREGEEVQEEVAVDEPVAPVVHYLHPETGEEITEAALLAYLEKYVGLLAQQVQYMIDEALIVAASGTPVGVSVPVPDVVAAQVYTHPDTGASISREELAAYLEGEIAKATKKLEAMQRLATLDDQPVGVGGSRDLADDVPETDVSVESEVDEPVVVSDIPQDFERLKYGDRGPRVLSLQQFLNGHGFPLVAYGPGSPGQETDFFGVLTTSAVKSFQESNDLQVSGVFDLATHRLVTSLAPDVFGEAPGVLDPSIDAVVWEDLEDEEENVEEDEEDEGGGFFHAVWRFIVGLFT